MRQCARLFRESFTLWKHTQKSLGETQFQGDVIGKGITNAAIALQLFLSIEISCRRVFDGPETVPNGTGDKGSGVCCTAAKNNAFLPKHAKGGSDEEAGRNERNALFLQHLLGQLQIPYLLGRSTPDFPAVTRLSSEEACSKKRSARSTSAEKKNS